MGVTAERHGGRFTRVLIANRGEIACRIMKTARRMGMGTVAVYSDAEEHALHVSLADEAVRIGPAPAAESYLCIDRIIDAAIRTGAQAIHPGYGFLSENAEFAHACREAGLVFVGPPVEAIRAMASKSAARALMQQSGVPLVPGYHGEEQEIERLAAEADRIGFPVLVKASAGGGGKGMRLAADADALAEAVAAAKREASAAFGDDRVLIEKYIARPRHIEVQVFGDMHGNIVSLFERECTLQRRHQKVLEEAPAPSITEETRERICAAARSAAAAVGYVGAGTVEFVANKDGFHFIEMNTRLQVEHPVTEAITGLDLVEWQFRIAAGEAIPHRQDEIRRSGHAIEVRIYAEDPQSGFLPSIGRIEQWRQPPTGDGVRIDSGFRQGDRITPHYDPMLAKLIIHAPDRSQALEGLGKALGGFQIAGVRTNLGFLQRLAAHADVHAGQIDTGYIERRLPELLTPEAEFSDPRDLAAAVAAVLSTEAPAEETSPWDLRDGFSLAAIRARPLVLNGTMARLRYHRDGMILEGAGTDFGFRFATRPDRWLDVFLGDRKEVVGAVRFGREFEVTTPRGRWSFILADPYAGAESAAVDPGHLRAPMPGSVTQVMAREGEMLKRGAPILVLEAMKMEHTLTAPRDGVLAALHCKAGDFVQEGTELASIESEDGS